jgi:hypothetical protein
MRVVYIKCPNKTNMISKINKNDFGYKITVDVFLGIFKIPTKDTEIAFSVKQPYFLLFLLFL